MTIKQFWERCKNNWATKVICLIVAVFFYFFYQNINLVSRNFVIPLQVSSAGDMLPASFHQPKVKIEVRGKQEDVNRMIENDFSAFLDLDYYTEPGTYDVPVQISLSDSVLAINLLEVKCSPSVIKMKVARRAYGQVPVEVMIQGKPADGFQVTDISVIPSSVGITGPEPLVRAMKSVVTDNVLVDDAKKSFSQTVSVMKDNKLVSFTGSKQVEVKVSIEPIQTTKDIAMQTIYLSGLDPSYEVVVEPTFVNFTLSGNQNVLENYKTDLYTVSSDCTKINSEGVFELPIDFSIPSGCKISSQSSKTIKVTVTIPKTEEILEDSFDSQETVIESDTSSIESLIEDNILPNIIE